MNVPLRSPREKIAGWAHLARFIDKVRLHQAGKLPEDYQANFCKGFDGYWLEGSGVNKDSFFEVVRKSKTDSEIEQWVKVNIRKTSAEVDACNRKILNRGNNDDVAQRFQEMKIKAGFAGRDDVRSFADLIDADEGRL